MPVYTFTDWNLAHQDADAIVYRPGLKTFMGRWLWTVLAGIVIAGLYFGIVNPLTRMAERKPIAPATQQQVEKLTELTRELEEDLRATMTEEQWQAFQREQEQKKAEREARYAQIEARQRTVVATVIGIVGGTSGVLGLVGILAPLSVLWNRTRIARDIRGNLTVSTRGLWPRTRTWPMESFGRISVYAKEIIHRVRYGGEQSLGWRWHVWLEASGGEAVGPVSAVVAFCPHEEKQLPSLQGRMPERVATLVNWLENVTRLPVSGPTTMAYSGVKPGLLTTKRQFKSIGAPRVEKRTFRSLNEMPPELRAQAEKMMAEGKAGHVASQTITVRDAEGNVRTYNSLDEMPPELRARIEEMRRQQRGS